MNADQWKYMGDCAQCRKQKYCSKPCKARKNRAAQQLSNATKEVMEERINENSRVNS